HRGGDEVEHDGGYDDVAAARDEEPCGSQRPEHAARGRGEHREREGGPAQYRSREQAYQRGQQAPDIGLAIAADIENAGMERQSDREPRQDEVGGVIERVAEARAVSSSAGRERAQGFDGVGARSQHDECRDQQGRQQIDQWNQDRRAPTQYRVPQPHAASAPAISRLSPRSLAASGPTSPTMRPPHSTSIRSESNRTSSRSAE